LKRSEDSSLFQTSFKVYKTMLFLGVTALGGLELYKGNLFSGIFCGGVGLSLLSQDLKKYEHLFTFRNPFYNNTEKPPSIEDVAFHTLAGVGLLFCMLPQAYFRSQPCVIRVPTPSEEWTFNATAMKGCTIVIE